MPKSKKLHNKISKKLDQLQEIVDEINEVQNLNSDDPETWDSDTLYNLVEQCKEVIKLLEDKTHPKQKDSFDEPLILEVGLCSLLDEYHADEEESEDY